MAHGTLKLRYVAQIDRMLERLVRFVARTAAAVCQSPKIDGMFEWSRLYILYSRPGRVVNHSVTNVTVVSNDFARLTDVLTVMTAEAALRIDMAGIVWMSLPIGPHLGEEVVLKDALQFFDRLFDRVLSLGKDLGMICPVKAGNV